MLEVRLLTKRYSGIPVVDAVSFSIRPGEILGYLGPNGAGKSTTVKMLTGLLEPTSGHIAFHGQDVRQDLKAFQRRIGYVPEEPQLYPVRPKYSNALETKGGHDAAFNEELAK